MDNKDRKVDNWCFYFIFSCFVPSFSRSGLVWLASFVVGCNCHFQVSIGSPCHHHLFHSQFIFPSNFPSPNWATNFPVSVFPSQLCGRGPGVRRECPLFFPLLFPDAPTQFQFPSIHTPTSVLRTPFPQFHGTHGALVATYSISTRIQSRIPLGYPFSFTPCPAGRARTNRLRGSSAHRANRVRGLDCNDRGSSNGSSRPLDGASTVRFGPVLTCFDSWTFSLLVETLM